MKNLLSLALRVENNTLLVLNQTKLPFVSEWIACERPEQMAQLIKILAVRGAPLIGIAAALSLARYVEQGATHDEIEAAATLLIHARPTAVNLSYCISEQMKAYRAEQDPKAIIDQAVFLFEEDAKLSETIANHGAELIQDGEKILTHCNTGGLVTTGIGTALGAIIRAHQQGKQLHVYVDETRPLLQGARLTCWELEQQGIPYTLICDNMAASLMRQGKIHRAITGADRIAANGDTANKIGTYAVAALCHLHQIPFHIAAPHTTIDWDCAHGDEIVIEERAANEVKGFGETQWAPSEAQVYNPAFDVTPRQFISSWVTDGGVFSQLINSMYCLKNS